MQMSDAIKVADRFDAAEYFDCRESEEYSHSTPDEALEEYFECFYEKGVPILDLIDKHAPIEMLAFDREKVTKGWIDSLADELLERAREQFAEDYGDHDGDFTKSTDQDDEIRGDLCAAINRVVASASVWRCEEVAKRTYSAEMIEAVLREHCPEWFTEETP